MRRSTKAIRPESEDVLYLKRGRKYVPCSDPWAIAGLRDGCWLVHVRPGVTTIRRPTWPDRAGMSAAMEEAREAMVKALVKAGETVEGVIAKPLTSRERRAYAAYKKVVGSEAFATFWRCSPNDLIDAGLEALK